MDQLKSQVRNSFTKLKNAMELREKLLLRQLEVLENRPDKTQIDLSEISFQTPDELRLLDELRTYGNYQNLDTFLPYLESFEEDSLENAKDQLYEKKIDSLESLDNKKLSESIIKLTLSESQDLLNKSENLVSAVQDKLKSFLDIDQTKVKEKDEEKEEKSISSIKQSEKLKRNTPTTSSKKKTLKNISNLTLNNYCGSIILKNISNLTINTCKTTKPPEVITKPCDNVFYPECEFYSKLISENEALKRSIVSHSVTYPEMIAKVCESETKDDATYSVTDVSSSSAASIDHEEVKSLRSSIGGHMGDAFAGHPPMIQCWLSKMYTETETEPNNGVEMLEFSKIA